MKEEEWTESTFHDGCDCFDHPHLKASTDVKVKVLQLYHESVARRSGLSNCLQSVLAP